MATRPNILILMVDQLTGTLFPDGPADFLHAPNLKRLAARFGQSAPSVSQSRAAGATVSVRRPDAPRPAPRPRRPA